MILEKSFVGEHFIIKDELIYRFEIDQRETFSYTPADYYNPSSSDLLSSETHIDGYYCTPDAENEIAMSQDEIDPFREELIAYASANSIED